MEVKLTRLTHKIAIHLHLVAERCTICSSPSRRPVRKLLDTPSYIVPAQHACTYHYTIIATKYYTLMCEIICTLSITRRLTEFINVYQLMRFHIE
jgi:hypothetical protein